MLNIYKFLKPVHIYIRVTFFFGNLWCVSDRAYNHEEMVTAEWPWWLNLWSQRLPESQYVHSRHRRRATGKLSSTHHSECLKVHCVPYGQRSDILYSTTAPPATQVWVLTQSTFPIMVPSVSFPLFRSYLYCPMYKKSQKYNNLYYVLSSCIWVKFNMRNQANFVFKFQYELPFYHIYILYLG